MGCLEPGYYEDEKFGIRIENIVVVQKASPPNNFGGKEYYKFEHVTMVYPLYCISSLRGSLLNKTTVSYAQEARRH